jgi:hypothetical protein
MRFEPELQQELLKLATYLEIDFTPFAPTTAPVSPTQYDQTDVEASFERASDLLAWAVLRMFFGPPDQDAVSVALAAPDDIEGERGRGLAELSVLRARIDAVFANPDYEAVQAQLDTLRREARLGADKSAPLLHELGLWNALAEIVSPGALARIRDTGTFYHFIEYNPNAAEWGIFWLRQASTAGARLMTFGAGAPNGVATLVDRLLAKLAVLPNVTLALGRGVSDIRAGADGTVELEFSGGSQESFDHVILALPQAPLRQLASHFNAQIRQDIEAVMPLPLLKAFLVVEHPWWNVHAEAQSHAWMVPTRELHYYTIPGAQPECPAHDDPEARCTCPVNAGMVMLYTDHPAIEFWRPLLPEGPKFNAITYSRATGAEEDARMQGLRRALVRQLLVEANPDIAAKINSRRARVEDGLIEALGGLGANLVRRSRQPGMRLDQVLADHLRNSSAEEREVVERLLDDLFGDSRGWVGQLLRRQGDLLVERLEDGLADVLSYGIHDWSGEPFGGAAHCWRPGIEPTAVRARLTAFSLEGSATTNVHICGEAYSDFQGFIEGALRSARHVVETIIGEPVGELRGAGAASPAAGSVAALESGV